MARLIDQFERLPGIGPRTAQRLALHLLRQPEEQIRSFADALLDARSQVGQCQRCSQGRIPNITPAHLTWTASEIAEYLNSGFTPDYDSAGGSMAAVVTNLSHLPDTDRQAIAAYLARVPPLP